MKTEYDYFWHDETTPEPVDNGTIMKTHKLKVCYGFNPDDTMAGGVTVVYGKTSDNKNCRMVEVSLAYCAPGDVFCKKAGLQLALDRWMNGNTVLVPARTHGQNWTTPVNLIRMFWNFPTYSLI